MTTQLTPSQKFWTEKLKQAEQSGLSLVDFARQENIPAQKLYQWRSTLRSKTTSVTQETRFTRVVTSAVVGGADLTVVLPSAKLQFQSLPDVRWLSELQPGQDDDLHEVIAERYERTSTIVTSNLDFVEWGEAFPNKLLGAATLDRLRHRAHQVTLDEKSYRTPRPSGEATKTVAGQAVETAE